MTKDARNLPDEMLVEDLEKTLSTRTYWCLTQHWNYKPTLGEVRQARDAELLRIDNFGKRCLEEVRALIGGGNPTVYENNLLKEVTKLREENRRLRRQLIYLTEQHE